MNNPILQIETSATVGKCPWGIGTEVSNDLTPIQMMQKAGVDWTVEKIPSFVHHNGEQIATGMEALVRSTDSKVLTQVGGNWNPVQNEQAFEFFNDYCSAGDMEMSSAGSLKDGKMVYALAKVKESFDILGGDQVDSYLLFSNPHEYGKSIDIRFTPVRVTCMNSLALALNRTSVNSTKINHRKAFDAEQVKVTMGLAHEKFDQYKVMAELLSKRQFTAATLIQYYNSLFPSQSPAAEVKTYNDLAPNAKKAFELLETQPGAEYGRGSWWQAFNSVTYLTDHQLGRTADGRMTSAWFGANQVKKKKAAELAVEMAVA
jgi:phage/plasmid-like protein (TIGR03299 family)